MFWTLLRSKRKALQLTSVYTNYLDCPLFTISQPTKPQTVYWLSQSINDEANTFVTSLFYSAQ
jgi:hypothetical protein